MHILFLTQVLPYPLDAGPKVRAYHMLRHLSRQHRVTLVSFTRPDDPPAALAHLREVCAAVHTVPIRRSAWRNVRAALRGLLTGLPITIARDDSAEMAARLRRLTAETRFDVIHADQLSMAWWGLLAARAAQGAGAAQGTGAALAARAAQGAGAALAARAAQGAGAEARPYLLLDEHNAIYLLAQRMADTEAHPLRRLIMRREARAFRRYEAAVLRACDAILTVTEEDREHLLALLDDPTSSTQQPTFTITPIPICVDPEQVAVVPRARGGPPTILHLGTMFWPPNVAGVLWFAREVLPLIHAEVPDARFLVVGKNPPAEVQALAADPRVVVTGYVADPTPHLAAADAFVTPLHAGGGMRVKILDAWLWGLPVVSTPIGAEGIDLRDGENILIAPDAAAFAAATLRVLTDPAFNARLRAAGRAWVAENYAWQTVYQRVDAVYGRWTIDD